MNTLEEKDKEIERLNNIINGEFAIICREKMIDKLSAVEMIVLQEKEINKLNNIINELEKASDEIFHKYPYERQQWFLKLKELKGSDK